jgi:hypothetical protein
MPRPPTEIEVRLIQALKYSNVHYVLDYTLPVVGRSPYHFAAMVYKGREMFGLIDYEGTWHRRGRRQVAVVASAHPKWTCGMGRIKKLYNREKLYYCLKNSIRYFRVYRNAEIEPLKMGIVRWMRLGWLFGRSYPEYHAKDDFANHGLMTADPGKLEEWWNIWQEWEKVTPPGDSFQEKGRGQKRPKMPPMPKWERQ